MNRRDVLRGILGLALLPFVPRLPRQREQPDEVTTVDLCDGTIVAAGSVVGKSEIAYTEDWGETWVMADGPPAEIACLRLYGSGLYAGCADGTLWFTGDMGQHWNKVATWLSSKTASGNAGRIN